jgi:hypothetical protein
MGNGIVLVPEILVNRLDGAFADVEGRSFSPWPDEPSGTATQSERGQGLQLAETDARSLPEVVVYEHINFSGAAWRTNLNYLYVGSW